MIGAIVGSIRRVFEQVLDFLLLVFRMPAARSAPNPSKEAARQVRRASHVASAGTFFTGTSATDKVLGKELAAGHKTTIYGDPMADRPLVSYGGRAPLQHRKPSRLVTALLVALLILILVTIMQSGFFPLAVFW